MEFKYTLDQIDELARQLLVHFTNKTILFYGEMGSGKTTLINALVKALGSSDVATSPTFSIVNEYELSNDKVYHFDFYRIESIEEALNFGIEDYFSGDNWNFLEWPERITELLPKDSNSILITKLEDKSRSLKLTITNKNLTENNAMTVPKF
ncbi:tRNA (adenosine(37)-N6)-threonylcarbamoyltransferase complex ATPase subunit type 1 TsaE [Winogradskyella sp. D23]|uniref:tRNA threonylcarbamoyladenosine biosynthesis protein TsaE n=1 Tax=Winogradskyella alexanderae TaxID=2877123 RepID=A0ABS7XRR5_9FLAO|nr:tRNA (adenosine(37)-N6)-threonylcarbamoyltransferase complex ATPase subunit type 1 TsaE [Winogradskyella alexanderae]